MMLKTALSSRLNKRQAVPMSYQFEPVAIANTPYDEKFAVPRQPNLVTADSSSLTLLGDCNRQEIVRGLEGFSHLWLTFVFHQAIKQDWKPMVRPPRLGGNEKVGVFASRSPFRPNPIGLSVVKFESIEFANKQTTIHISGADLVNGTPVLDIKPYLPYADIHSNAEGGYAPAQPKILPVIFSDNAKAQLENHNVPKDFDILIEEILQQQPEPKYHEGEREYGVSLYGVNVRWLRSENALTVLSVE